ncbi:MAG: substrate-binding domain-containing protein [Chloroflexi bacterium]|nr:substrate-binding domain-containing protein [Chloroflexota bacterium]
MAEGLTTEQLNTTSIRDRYAGYCQALQHYHLSSAIMPPYPVDHSSKESVARLLLEHRSTTGRPPAIVALHDHLASELINTAARIGLRAPTHFAIVGYDDLPIASHLAVPLTTVVQPRYDIGFRAGHLVIDKIEGNSIRNDKLSLLVSLIVRESCGALWLMRQRMATPSAVDDTLTKFAERR